jgi:hypothetical protein
LNQIRKRLTYANVMSTIAVFLVLGGATAIAASQLGKNSVGSKQLKANSVTQAKIKKNAITTAKIKNGAVTGTKVNVATLATVPNSAKTDVVKSSKGTIALGQQATVFEDGPVKLIVKCETYEVTRIAPHAYIESSADGTTFASWEDNNKAIGPVTPEAERELTRAEWADSTGPMESEPGAPVDVTTASGASFAGVVGVASEKASSTCWYWFHGTIIS